MDIDKAIGYLSALQGTLWPSPDLPNALLSIRWATHWTSVPFLYPILAGLVVSKGLLMDFGQRGVILILGEVRSFILSR